MSTRSYIGVECDDGIRAIYCHWDGGPDWNGRMLAEHYQDFMKVCSLINNGDLSSLRENVEPKKGEYHSFDRPQHNVCVYYGRDRGEEDVGFDHVLSESEFLENAYNCFAEYAYLFVNGQWVSFKV